MAMRCREALSQLSLLLDEMLESKTASEVFQHLNQCPECRLEYDRLAKLQVRLRTLERVPTPDFFPDLLKIRLASAKRESWSAALRSFLEYRWSRIRTTEGIWYLTRALGTTFSFMFFFLIYAALNQFYVGLHIGPVDRGGISPAESYQVVLDVLKNLGMPPLEAQKKPIAATKPEINGLYLVDFGQNALRSAPDDTFSVVTKVDKTGAAKIQNVLEYPADVALLTEFNRMITSARCRPARLNGRAVDSFLVLTFSKVSVYE
jgi:hypothetical protein